MTAAQREVTLADWLLACIAEDEAVARATTGGVPTGNWWIEPDEGGVSDISCLAFTGFVTAVDVDAAHIARHDPARVLADCEAKRRIVEWCGPRAHIVPGITDSSSTTAAHVLRALAQVYRDWPGWREEWSL